MVSTAYAAQDFAGMTTGIGLPVTFEFLSLDDIYAAQLLVGGETFINLVRDVDYEVVDLGGGAAEVNPLTTLASDITVRIFRMTSPTQPYTFSENGPLVVESIEGMGDRLCMIEQETRLLAGIDSAAVTTPAGVLLVLTQAVFANSTARGNATPAFLGQWAVQLDSGAAYRGTALAAGGWTIVVTGSGGVYDAGNGLTLTGGDTFEIDTTVTADLATAQTLINKTLGPTKATTFLNAAGNTWLARAGVTTGGANYLEVAAAATGDPVYIHANGSDAVIDLDLRSKSGNVYADGVQVANKVGVNSPAESFIVPFSDLVTPLTAGTSKAYFDLPYNFQVTGVAVTLLTAQASGTVLTVNVKKSGTTILSTKITVDNAEVSSRTAAVPPVISVPTFSTGNRLTVDIDAVDGATSAVGAQLCITGYKL